jgi:hypothetical protein
VQPTFGHEPYEIERDELQMQMLARNAFRSVMVGAAVFLLACGYVFVT